jgi:hypothetical protein
MERRRSRRQLSYSVFRMTTADTEHSVVNWLCFLIHSGASSRLIFVKPFLSKNFSALSVSRYSSFKLFFLAF